MTNNDQNITKLSIGKLESEFLSKVGSEVFFSLADVEKFLGPDRAKFARQFLSRLRQKGWLERIKPGLFAVIPLSSGAVRTPQLHEFVVAMELVRPAAVSHFSAMNFHGFTEQLPHTVYISTDHRISRPLRQSIGFSFRIIALRPARFFGIRQEWIDERPILVTDREKTIIDGFDLPEYAGGIGTLSEALIHAWPELNETRLIEYALKMGNSAAVKRLGFLMEIHGLGKPEAVRKAGTLAAGYPRLDPALPPVGKHNKRWGLLVNSRASD